MNTSSLIADQTLHWVKHFIIQNNLCPFAKKPVSQDRLRIAVTQASKQADAMQTLMIEIQRLDQDSTIETTLLVFALSFKDFFAYLDFVDLAQQMMEHFGYEGIYQLATFHPEYCFADTPFDSPANYTNRSPYPMIHLLREDLLEKAIQAYGDTSLIPEKNIQTMEAIGLEKLKSDHASYS